MNSYDFHMDLICFSMTSYCIGTNVSRSGRNQIKKLCSLGLMGHHSIFTKICHCLENLTGTLCAPCALPCALLAFLGLNTFEKKHSQGIFYRAGLTVSKQKTMYRDNVFEHVWSSRLSDKLIERYNSSCFTRVSVQSEFHYACSDAG